MVEKQERLNALKDQPTRTPIEEKELKKLEKELRVNGEMPEDEGDEPENEGQE